MAFEAATAAREGPNAEKFGIQSNRACEQGLQCRKYRHSKQLRLQAKPPMPKISAFKATAPASEASNAENIGIQSTCACE
ncbi:hypothetical protein [Cohnella xylanilytica]|uniref:hypothetical protein n=1 Tax=Cohnella xylanilytica TaxID=557555 RepID=UPI001BB2FC20|nr:hypothetical protein [Cohnella xylanilytica]